MERYDGKTKKDDYIKYALIALGVVVLIVLYKLVTWGIHRASHPTPDITVVVGAELALQAEEEMDMEDLLETYMDDYDGNGKIVADVVALHLVENEVIEAYGLDQVGAETDIDKLREYMTEGDYTLFLLQDEIASCPAVANYCNKSYCRSLPEDLADVDNPYYTELTGCKLFSDVGWERVPVYGCIHKEASDEQYAQAVNILRALKGE